MIKPLMTRILMATDFSEGAACAQTYAAYLASRWAATLEVLHVIEAPHRVNAETESLAAVMAVRAHAAQQLAEVREDLVRCGLSVKVRLVLGNPAEHIGVTAKDEGAELIVLGVQGRTNMLCGLIGGTTERVVREAPCPVLAVPGLREEAGKPSAAGPKVQIRHILAPLDFSSPSLDAVEYAVQLANGLRATVTLMHVLEPVCYDLDCGLGLVEQEAQKRDHWNKQLEELRTFVTSFGLAADVEIAGGMASDVILASALRHRSDLIVMGTHGRRGLSVERFGSVADAVLRRATCPVLTVKAPKFAPNHRRIMPQTMSETETEGAER
ncbi:MAG: universal stress protein [Nitrospira sp.]|nr:universal stress protein [Nitrospira sp.]